MISRSRRKHSVLSVATCTLILTVGIGVACLLMLALLAMFSFDNHSLTSPLYDALRRDKLDFHGETKQIDKSSRHGVSSSQAKISTSTDKLIDIDLKLTKKKGFPGSRSVIAYAISITSCPVNTTTVFDGPAILSHSIHRVSIRHNSTLSKYDYSLYAFVHPEATNCTHFLEILGYNVIIRDLPFNLNDIQSENYKTLIEEDGCCGSREFLKLWAYALTNHDIVVHTDTDVMFLKPLDLVFDAMLDSDASKHTLPSMFGNSPPSQLDFLYTRDYLQRSHITKNPKRYGVQGGFFVAKPSLTILNEMTQTILRGNYERGLGWGLLKYGGYWGSSQIQGFLSYFYGEIHPKYAMELNRCIYNTMVDDPPQADGACRTGELECEDCRETPFTSMVSVHLTTCWKPWLCPTLKPPHPERCKEVHRAWFELRQSLELSWGYTVPTDGWWFPRTLGYCTKQSKEGRRKKRFYLPLELPNRTSLAGQATV
jgi:hypothetical protein